MTIGVLIPDGLAPIALSELDGCAALTTRVERKYVLTKREAEVLFGMLSPEICVLEIGGRRSFHYRSVYFDTPGLDAYRATATSRRRRFKVRTREYVDSNLRFIEVKTRRGRFTVKDREPYVPTESITSEAAGHIARYLSAASVSGIDTAALAPALRTYFQRTTLYLPESGSRVTFDTDLSFSTAIGERRGRTLEFPELAILETKTSGLPSSVDHLLWSLGIRPTRFSKFGTGLAGFYPELPHAKWARLLRTHLAVA